MPNAKTSCFVDTNVLVYAIDERSPSKQERAAWWLRELSAHNAIVLSPQSLNEFYVVASRKLGSPRDRRIRDRVWKLARWCIVPFDLDLSNEAWVVEDRTGYQYWDCLLLASALRAGCRAFLSEDLEHERRIDSLTIFDPFKIEPAYLLSP